MRSMIRGAAAVACGLLATVVHPVREQEVARAKQIAAAENARGVQEQIRLKEAERQEVSAGA